MPASEPRNMYSSTPRRRSVLLGAGVLTLTGLGMALRSSHAQSLVPVAPTTSPSAPSLLSSVSLAPRPNKPLPLKSASAILIDAESGQVLYALNPDVCRPMASTTKIMTALLLTEYLRDEEIITASVRAAKTRESSMHLKKGEQVPAYDMLRAILMRSANDGCVATAEQIAGSVEAFAHLMNSRAQELGATRTHFMNPHGLHHPLHYTTARDLANIARHALREPRINEVVRLKRTTIRRSINTKDVSIKNHSRFLGRFAGADGVKTGYTNAAGKCYVGSATQKGWRLISVVLKSKDYVNDSRLLMTYGFQRFQPHILAPAGNIAGFCQVEGGDRTECPVAPERPLQIITPRDVLPTVTTRIVMDPVQAPVEIGRTVGRMEAVTSEGVVLHTVPLVATQPVLPALVQKAKPRRGMPAIPVAATIFLVGLVSLRYGTRSKKRSGLTPLGAAAKSLGRRWRRVTKSLRGTHYSRPHLG